MKTCIALLAIALIAIFMAPTESVKVCTIRCNVGNTAQVCGKSGAICRRFRNSCDHQTYNCLNSQTYGTVALSRCRGISVGRLGSCKAATNTNTTSGVSILNTLNSLYPNGNIVTPIVIKV